MSWSSPRPRGTARNTEAVLNAVTDDDKTKNRAIVAYAVEPATSNKQEVEMMKRKMGVLAAMLVAGALFAAPMVAKADDAHHPAEAAAKDDSSKDTKADDAMGGQMMQMHKMSAEHQQVFKELLGMVKDTMAIVRDLSHKPTEEQKKQLDAMIKKLDDISKKHEDMMKKKQDMMK